MNITILEIRKTFENLLARIEVYNDGELDYQINEIKRALKPALFTNQHKIPLKSDYVSFPVGFLFSLKK